MMRHPAVLVLLALGLLLPRLASGHAGPPYPIILEREVGPYVASLWTDPDIGTGLFLVVFESHGGKTAPLPSSVKVGVRPVSGRLEEVVYTAQPHKTHGSPQFRVKVPLDRRDLWRVRVTLDGAEGGGEMTADVESTPDGLGPWGIALYVSPFLAVGFLWFWAARARRRRPAEVGSRQRGSFPLR